MKRVAIYARVSTGDQTCDNQLRDLREYCRARGWTDVLTFTDTCSGTRDRRSGLEEALKAVKRGEVSHFLTAAFDRVSRSTKHLIELLELFRHLGVEFISLREQIDTGSPLGQAVFTIIAAIAQLERSLIVERVKAGLRRAKAEGKRLGREPLQVDPHRLNDVVRRGLSARAAARELNCSVASAWRLLKARRAGAVDGHGASRAAEEVSLA
jgi:DNA invertase Pin-like site-specific DNA recombinase